jgi:glutamine synthetase
LANKTGPALAAKVAGRNELIDKKGIRIIDLKFADLPGTWQHFSITRHEFDEGLFLHGIGFDGSSIRGFQTTLRQRPRHVFTKDVLETWGGLKRKEVDAIRLRPHPYEYFMYHDP